MVAKALTLLMISILVSGSMPCQCRATNKSYRQLPK